MKNRCCRGFLLNEEENIMNLSFSLSSLSKKNFMPELLTVHGSVITLNLILTPFGVARKAVEASKCG